MGKLELPERAYYWKIMRTDSASFVPDIGSDADPGRAGIIEPHTTEWSLSPSKIYRIFLLPVSAEG